MRTFHAVWILMGSAYPIFTEHQLPLLFLICFQNTRTAQLTKHYQLHAFRRWISKRKNVLGGKLQPCSMEPLTGFHRTVAARPVRTTMLPCGLRSATAISRVFEIVGNDLSTPIEAYGFPGLKAGDRWCSGESVGAAMRQVQLLSLF